MFGAPSARNNFEMLMHSVHAKAYGLTQTQPEPPLYARVVATRVDDVRFFGTEPEKEKYLREAKGKKKMTIEKPPIAEFVLLKLTRILNP